MPTTSPKEALILPDTCPVRSKIAGRSSKPKSGMHGSLFVCPTGPMTPKRVAHSVPEVPKEMGECLRRWQLLLLMVAKAF